MIVVGLTGSIGMGKSTAAEMLAQMGIPVHDSDVAARKAAADGGAAIPQLLKTFPQAFDAAGKLDRGLLGQLIFNDDAKRLALEAIIHPVVQQSQQDWMRARAAEGHKIVVLDIPLLYETGAGARVDKVIVVSAPFFIQKKRVMARPGMTESKFKGILASQMPDHEKRARADFVVLTGLGKVYTERALQKVIGSLLNGQSHNFPPYAR
ncbi:MAG: Dephospho-CoA kinase [Micavibrio sp.]|nr:Dephospho-CoA kinase [Micavibrio sp.]